MGMAASQARLLSITSRMADNELRAQVINNSKMRLATESSRASEEYIDALNSATMMMSNYNTAGDSVYQKLTYNSLTAYSAYNNQYGLVNSYGQILVSEQEDQYYKLANGDVDTYLKEHGLEYKTTYFTEALGENCYIEAIDKTFSSSVLQAMYEGTDGYLGYEQTLNALYVDDFYNLYDNYIIAQNYYDNLLYSYKKESIFNSTTEGGLGFTDAYNDLNDINTDTDPTSGTYNSNAFTELNKSKTDIEGMLDSLKNSGQLEGSESNSLYTLLKLELDSITIDTNSASRTATDNVTEGKYNGQDCWYLGAQYYINGEYVSELVLTKDTDEDGNETGTYTIQANQAVLDYLNEDIDDDQYKAKYNFNNTDATSLTVSDINDLANFTYSINGYYEDEDDAGNTYWQNYQDSYDYAITFDDDGNVTSATATWEIEAAEAKSLLLTIYGQFEAQILGALDNDYYTSLITTNSGDTGGATVEAITYAQNAAEAAKNELLYFIFGGDKTENTDADGNTTITYEPAYSDVETSILGDVGALIKYIDSNDDLYASEAFDYVEYVYILDQVFNTYGEPAYGWFDINDSTGSQNADAKAQWYTNLFNRMKEGYKVLEDGLASSNEWIQFALESGLVTMEQVDSTNTWNATIYSNCSDITEVTDDVAVAKAEAVYNREMNNIENKDSRYDIELKNIDTEHDSLQTEYDSVKSVIDKNIERSFKIYS